MKELPTHGKSPGDAAMCSPSPSAGHFYDKWASVSHTSVLFITGMLLFGNIIHTNVQKRRGLPSLPPSATASRLSRYSTGMALLHSGYFPALSPFRRVIKWALEAANEGGRRSEGGRDTESGVSESRRRGVTDALDQKRRGEHVTGGSQAPFALTPRRAALLGNDRVAMATGGGLQQNRKGVGPTYGKLRLRWIFELLLASKQ